MKVMLGIGKLANTNEKKEKEEGRSELASFE